jgi:hypothetical protein
MGGDIMMRSFKIENGALVEVPIFEEHKRGKNWMAKISFDPRSPAGLSREFMVRARGKYFYMVEGLKVGDAIEFGADYYTTSRKRHTNRVYAAVVALTSTELTLELYSTSSEAIEAAKKIKETAENAEEVEAPSELERFSDAELIAELERRGYKIIKEEKL